MLKTCIYEYPANGTKYFTRNRTIKDNAKKIIEIRITPEEYTGIISSLIYDISQIEDGVYQILDYPNFETYLSQNIYKIEKDDIKLSIPDFLDLLDKKQRRLIANWKYGNDNLKLCFISSPLILEKIKLIFIHLSKKTKIVGFAELQKSKKAICLVDVNSFIPCLKLNTDGKNENNEIYDIDSLLKNNKHVLRKDIEVIVIPDFPTNIRLFY